MVLAGPAAGREEFVQTLILTLHIIVCVLLVILIPVAYPHLTLPPT